MMRSSLRNSIRQLVRRARRSAEDLWLARSPRRLVLADLAPAPVAFTVHSAVERYRIQTLGGEREVLRRFLSALRPGDVVFDIGASVGVFAIAGAANLESADFYAFEPDPLTRTHLEANIHQNQLGNVTVIPWAVSDQEGEAVLYSSGPSGHAASMRRQGHPGGPQAELRVRTRSLDQAIGAGDLPAPTVLKLDIEGAEGLCLRGAQKLLQGDFGTRPREIFVEIHPELLAGFQISPFEIQDDMARLGYKPAWSMERSAQVQIHYRELSATRPPTPVA